MGVVGMGMGVGVLLWTFWELVVGLVERRGGGVEVVKRVVEATRVVQTGRTSLLQPIVSPHILSLILIVTNSFIHRSLA